jgi:hypothetical protein
VTRLREVGKGLFYGLAPWWLYERECHYAGWSYREHLAENLRLAWRWATWRETKGDREFAAEASS